MSFCSPLFLFFFMPLVFLFYFLAKGKMKNKVLVSTSFFFYFYAESRFFPIVLISVFADYFICHCIFRSRGKTKAKYLLALGLILNVLLLFYYKYMDFFISTINSLSSYLHLSSLPLLKIALPIGVSFIVFEKITYLVDVYKGIGPPAKSIRDYLLYIFLFPKLLAGPIVKYHDIAAQLINHQQRATDFFEGFKRFLIGLIKKVLLADTVGEVANAVFGMPPGQLGFTQAWLGVISFTLQIYLDFSAYSDMAIGLARMFGFRLLENFNMPYISANFTEFWRRWHISLSTWIKEYLYFPIGGNRRGTARTYLNLCICFFISGLWHGAKLDFSYCGGHTTVFF